MSRPDIGGAGSEPPPQPATRPDAAVAAAKPPATPRKARRSKPGSGPWELGDRSRLTLPTCSSIGVRCLRSWMGLVLPQADADRRSAADEDPSSSTGRRLRAAPLHGRPRRSDPSHVPPQSGHRVRDGGQSCGAHGRADHGGAPPARGRPAGTGSLQGADSGACCAVARTARHPIWAHARLACSCLADSRFKRGLRACSEGPRNDEGRAGCGGLGSQRPRGAVDLDDLTRRLSRVGGFAVTQRSPGTLGECWGPRHCRCFTPTRHGPSASSNRPYGSPGCASPASRTCWPPSSLRPLSRGRRGRSSRARRPR